MIGRFARLLSAALLGVCLTLAAHAAPLKIAVFDFELEDGSLEGETYGVDPRETARLAMVTRIFAERIGALQQFELIDTTSLRSRLALMPALRGCGGCEVALAKELGAELAATGYVKKISTLILYIDVTIRDVATGKPVKRGNVSIRGNTDESWAHGARYMVKRRLFPKDKK